MLEAYKIPIVKSVKCGYWGTHNLFNNYIEGLK